MAMQGVTVAVRVDEVTAARWKQAAAARGVSLSAFVRDAVEREADPPSTRGEVRGAGVDNTVRRGGKRDVQPDPKGGKR